MHSPSSLSLSNKFKPNNHKKRAFNHKIAKQVDPVKIYYKISNKLSIKIKKILTHNYSLNNKIN
jgi:hypothetical protein